MLDRSRSALLAALTATLVVPALHTGAGAAGLGRPNVASARALGWGGAFTAIADDATALHHNPAGMALQLRDSFMVGAEIIIAPRSYTPVDADGNEGEPQSPSDAPHVLPMLGYVTRLGQEGVPSRLALGIGFWNTFGGQLEYEKGEPNVGAIEATQTAVLELVPGIAYEVNDFLQVGAGFRLGFGLFSVKTNKKPVTADLSSFGVGAGLTLGVMVAPSKSLRIGAVWRSPLTTNTKGTGTTETSIGEVTVKHAQEWPQQAALGVHWQAAERFGVSLQADWTDWSRLQHIFVDLGTDGSVDLVTDFEDSYAFHLGAQLQATERLAVRAGYTYDSSAVPDRTIERQYLDAVKHIVGLGVSYQLTSSWRLDSALEYVGGPARMVPDNRAEYADFPERANAAPGIHEGQIYSLELAGSYSF